MGGGQASLWRIAPKPPPPKNYWPFYIAAPSLSSNSARKARMLRPLKMFVPLIVSPVARPPGIPKGFCRW